MLPLWAAPSCRCPQFGLAKPGVLGWQLMRMSARLWAGALWLPEPWAEQAQWADWVISHLIVGWEAFQEQGAPFRVAGALAFEVAASCRWRRLAVHARDSCEPEVHKNNANARFINVRRCGPSRGLTRDVPSSPLNHEWLRQPPTKSTSGTVLPASLTVDKTFQHEKGQNRQSVFVYRGLRAAVASTRKQMLECCSFKTNMQAISLGSIQDDTLAGNSAANHCALYCLLCCCEWPLHAISVNLRGARQQAKAGSLGMRLL